MKTLKSFEFKSAVGGSKHDWNKLLDGGIYQLEQGKDFTCKVTTMGMLIRQRAKKRGLLVKVGKVDGGLVLQQVGKDPNFVPPAPKEKKAKTQKAAAKTTTPPAATAAK